MLVQHQPSLRKVATSPRNQPTNPRKNPTLVAIAQQVGKGFLVDDGALSAKVEASLVASPAQQAAKLEPPSVEAYRLDAGTHRSTYAQWNQDMILMPILKQLGRGFFVESGALDGETHSNSLFLELNLGWSGLLVEPDPRFFPKILAKHRHAYAFNGCLSPSGRAETVQFSFNVPFGLSQIKNSGSLTVQAQPLQALLEAAGGQKVVDFWSLDIEGSEGKVLKTTDFSKVEVGVLLIEMAISQQNNVEIREVMDREGFREIGHTHYDGGILDYIFINPKYFQKRNLPVPSESVLSAQYRGHV